MTIEHDLTNENRNEFANKPHIGVGSQEYSGGKDVTDQFMLLSQTPGSNSNAKVGSVTQINTNGGFLAPGAIIDNKRSSWIGNS